MGACQLPYHTNVDLSVYIMTRLRSMSGRIPVAYFPAFWLVKKDVSSDPSPLFGGGGRGGGRLSKRLSGLHVRTYCTYEYQAL
jgi:hypothetical protein